MLFHDKGNHKPFPSLTWLLGLGVELHVAVVYFLKCLCNLVYVWEKNWHKKIWNYEHNCSICNHLWLGKGISPVFEYITWAQRQLECH